MLPVRELEEPVYMAADQGQGCPKQTVSNQLLTTVPLLLLCVSEYLTRS